MFPPWFTPAVLALVVAGPLSHYVFWMRFEFDAFIHKFVPWVLLFQAAAFFSLMCFEHLGLLDSILTFSLLHLSYIVPVFTSIAIYRLYLHPTRIFPGPFWSHLSSWWRVKAYISYKGVDAQAYRVMDQLHQEYGDVVRFGSRHISINHVDAIPPLYGQGSPTIKSSSYEMALQGHIETERDFNEHHRRRTIWDRGLNPKSCQGYLPRVNRLVDLLIEKIAAYDGRPVVINDWCHFLSFDIMGDVGFGKTYDQLETGKMHPGVAGLAEFGKFGTAGWHLPWLVNIVNSIPGIVTPDVYMKRIAEESLDARSKEKPGVPDVLSHVLEPIESGKVAYDRKTLIGDTFLMQYAGSDTTYSALVLSLYYLAKYPEYQTRLRAEVRDAVSPSSSTTTSSGPPKWSDLNALPLLEGVVNETLRLHPPVPSGMGREAPRGGMQVGPYWVPGETVVSVPTWSTQRDDRYWVRGSEWLPERWSSSPSSTTTTSSSAVAAGGGEEMIRDRNAFVPFSVGPYNCAGKYFALMELKIFVAKVITAFDVGFAPGEDGQAMIDGQKDYFTLFLPDMNMSLVPREKA